MWLRRVINSEFFPIILILVIGIPSIWILFYPGYFSQHDDAQVIRLLEMQKCLKGFQIPCRWVPDMGAGYGLPLFNFHPIFPYYFGMIFRVTGVSLLNTLKILMGLAFLLPGVFIYFLTKEFFGKIAGVTAATFIIYAPYHSVDLYVRGALAESWGIVFFPLIFLGLYKYIKDKNFAYFCLSILSLFGLFLSHNIMAMLFTPFAIAWALFWCISLKAKHIIKVVGIFIWAACLSAFFVLPALFEKNLVQIGTLISGYYDFHNHFATFSQLFLSRHWGYGPSQVGPNDDLSFQIGWPHWWVVILIVFYTGYAFYQKKRKNLGLIAFLLFVFSVSVFMTHAKSVLIWDSLPILAFTQFPWRFLSIVIFVNAFLVGYFIFIFKDKIQIYIAGILIILAIGLNAGYFHPQLFYPDVTDQLLLTGTRWDSQSKAILLDYLPNQVRVIPTQLAPVFPLIDPKIASIHSYTKTSNTWKVNITVKQASGSALMVPVFNFPIWKAFIDKVQVPISESNDYGLITVKVPSGSHIVQGIFTDTPIRTFSNLLSAISGFCLILTALFYYKMRRK